MIYTYEQAFKASLEYFNGDELAANIWIGKYCLKNDKGELLEQSPTDMHKRIAKELARIEQKYPNPISEQEIFDLIDKFRYIVPQGSPMAGIGNNEQVVSLSNCFVIGNGADSYGGIMQIDQEQAQLMKRRGGVGTDLSHIRPKGSPVKNSALTSTGVVPFMERYSNTTREVAQDGRRGALLISISCKHPDVADFIDAKLEKGKVTGANISVKMTDDFMYSVVADDDYLLRYPIDLNVDTIISSNYDYNKLYVVDGGYIKKIKAKELWKKLMYNAWKSAEPGILFWDTIIRESPTDCYKEEGFNTVTCNPCGEIPLCPNDSCRLLAINFYSYVNNAFTNEAFFDFKLFKKHSIIAQRLADDIIDLELEKIDTILEKINQDPEEDEIKQIEINLWKKIKQSAINGRRTGTGFTGLGDCIAALGLKYGTGEATEFATNLQKEYIVNLYESSIIMAKERGAFPIWNYDKEKNNPFINRILDNDLLEIHKQCGRRNISLATVAPTGTTSQMTQTSGGIEPVFKLAYTRRKKINPSDKNARVDFVDETGEKWQEFNVLHHKLVDWYLINNANEFSDILSCKRFLEALDKKTLDDIIKKSPYYGATANDIDALEKVHMQGQIQQYIDHSISVTANLPINTTVEQVNDLYIKAWKEGCKGCTVYREGSRSGVLINKEDGGLVRGQVPRNGHIITNSAPKRPKEIPCDIKYVTSKGVRWMVLVGKLNGMPYEVFAFKKENVTIAEKFTEGKLIKIRKGGVYNLEIPGVALIENINELFDTGGEEALTRMTALALRHGADVKFAYEQLDKSKDDIISFGKAIGRVLKNYIKENDTPSNTKCPNCNAEDGLYYSEGCVRCKYCEYGKC